MLTGSVMAAPPQVIIPEEKELAVEARITCSFENCSKTFKSSSCYRMHMTRHHGVSLPTLPPSPAGNTMKKEYYCPVSGCSRSNGGKPFPRLGQLKQHYNTVHGTKSFVCPRCGRAFGLKDAHGRHVKECGRIFTCDSCEDQFKSSNALYKHQKRSGHGNKSNKKTNDRARLAVPPIIIAPIIIKNVLPIQPLASKSETTISETVPSTSTRDDERDDEKEEAENTLNDLLDLGTQTDISCLMADQFLLPYSGTDESSSTLSLFPSSSFLSSQSVQTNTVSLCEFGTQTTSSQDWSEPLPWIPPEAHNDEMSLASFLESSACIDFGTQTLDDLPGHKDQESQT